MPRSANRLPKLKKDDPNEIVRRYFRKNCPKVVNKIQRQVRRSPRRQTGKYKTNRACRWKLDKRHPDYTSAKNIPLIEGKLMAQLLEFEDAPTPPAEVTQAAGKILGRPLQRGQYRCPVTGRSLSFKQITKEVENSTHGRSCFHVGHVKPRARGGVNDADNTYWTSDLGNRIQGDKSLHDTVKDIVEIAEFQRNKEGVSWQELVNRHLG